MYAHSLIRPRIVSTKYNGDLHSLDFTYNRMCMKLFKSSNVELIKECQSYFRCILPSLTAKERSQKLLVNTIVRSIRFVGIVMLCELNVHSVCLVCCLYCL